MIIATLYNLITSYVCVCVVSPFRASANTQSNIFEVTAISLSVFVVDEDACHSVLFWNDEPAYNNWIIKPGIQKIDGETALRSFITGMISLDRSGTSYIFDSLAFVC